MNSESSSKLGPEMQSDKFKSENKMGKKTKKGLVIVVTVRLRVKTPPLIVC